MKKRAGGGAGGERILFPEKYLYIFHITSFRVLRRQCRNYDDDVGDGGILLRHALEHLSPFARLVTRVTSRKPIDSSLRRLSNLAGHKRGVSIPLITLIAYSIRINALDLSFD